MSDNLNYRVFPQEAVRKTITLGEFDRKHLKGLDFDMGSGCLVWALLFVVVGFFSFNILGFFVGLIVALGGSFIAAQLINFSIKSSKAAAMERDRTDAANQSEIQRVTKDAEYLTSSLTAHTAHLQNLRMKFPTVLMKQQLGCEPQNTSFNPTPLRLFGMRLSKRRFG